uniref:Phosphatidylinositol phosphatase PTPRQ-like n=1 Tax=Sinocyclocheilus anshuiensis TaxID=1608454 RepID=A0A671LJN3_9TELE
KVLVPVKLPEGLRVISVSPHAFSLYWLASPGCDKNYMVQLHPDHGNINITTTADSRVQAQVSSVTPGTSYTVTVNAVASSGFSSPVSRILVTTNESLPAAPSKPEGERVGSNGILLSWRMPVPLDPSIHSFVIRYKEMCPYPDPTFTEVTKSLDIPETLLNTLTPGATYNIKVCLLMRYMYVCISGFISENSTIEQAFMYTGLTPYTQYYIHVMAKSAGATGPAAVINITTLAEAPSAVSHLTAEAVDSTSVRLSWRPPSRPNGLITHYRILVLYRSTLVQDITLFTDMSLCLQNAPLRRNARSLDITTSSAFILTSHGAFPALGRDFTILPATEETADLLSDHIMYVVRRLSPFTEYTFSVTAKNIIGEGPSTEVTVKTTEQVPSSVQNVSYQNLTSTSIRVTWEPPLNPNGKITHYTVYAQNLLTNQQLRQMADTTTEVLTGLDKYSSYKVRVAASTAVGESPLTDEDYIFVMTLEDEPDSPPRDLAVVKTTSSTAALTWSPPEKPNGIIRLYEVSYTNGTYSNTVNSTSPSATLRYLKPYTHYNVTVHAFTLHGHGNQISDTLQMLSGEDVPGSPPYDLTYENIGSSEVNVSWSPPILANGIILFYNVEYWNATHSLNQTTHVPYITLSNLRKYARYRISVQAATLVGLGNHTSEILNITTLEDVPSSPPKFLIARKLSDTEVELSWKPPEEANSEILYYILRVWNLSSEFVANVTETSVVVSVDGLGQYNASVSSWTRLGDGGMLIYITFSTIESAPSDPPQNVSYTLLTTTTVRLSWSPPNQPNGIIQYYTIYYTDNTKNNTKYTAGHEYSVWMSSSTSVGDGGVRSSPIINCISSTSSPRAVPSGPVHNLTATIYSSTAVVISWDPPLEPNGRVFYQLSLQEVGMTHASINRTVNITITKTTTDNIYLFTKLRKYFPYIIKVTPATSAGSALNHTAMLHLRTDEDVPSSPPLPGASRNLSSTSIHVSWFPAVEANGEIIDYAVVLQGPGTVNKTYTTETHLMLSELISFTPYNLSIAAVTRIGVGPSVIIPLHTDEAVPMSPPHDLIIFNHTVNSVWLQWEPSPEPNGIVQHYGFRILELNTYTFRYQNSSDASTQAELSGFRPHNSYEISVCAFTRAGNGDQYSLPVIFTTNESVKKSMPCCPLTSKSTIIFSLTIMDVTSDSVSLRWQHPVHVPGLLQGYNVEIQQLARNCEPEQHMESCVESELVEWVEGETSGVTLSPLLKYREYRIRLVAFTRAGAGEPSDWIHTQTLTGNPDAPPGAISVFPSPTGLKIVWDEPSVISGPTSYIIDIAALDGLGYNISLMRHSEEIRTVVVGNLTAFTLYSITITAFTGQLSNARTDGKASEPILVRTLEDEPKDPPKNVTLTVIPEEVTRVYVTFSPPDEPNGNISAYHVAIYRNGQLDFYINSLPVISNPNNTMTAIIDGLKGGFNYSIRIAAVNGAGLGPSSEVQVTTGVKAPPKPSRRPRAALNNAGIIISTSKTITIEMPECFFTDDHGPIQKVQVIVSEPAVMDYGNLSSWKSVFLYPTAPYLTDEGFLNPKCSEKAERMSTNTNTYVIGADESCLSEDARTLCNGPLKPKTYYVFKFRATNIRGQYTDSEYSDRVRTAGMDASSTQGLLHLVLLLTFSNPRIHRRQKEGGTYSPREAEIIETKFKLDQLIAVADLELKEEKINRPISKKSFLQHVEDLCANDNAKFQEEFAELPKLLQDLATSDADLPWNRSKNRFTNIKPYNNNRVKLLSEPGMPGSDYINASFVSGYLCPNEFIATQGPLPSTVADFWRMIWETGTKTIIMLTQCFEKGRIRCHQYWPEDNKPVTVFADIIITKLTEDVHPDWTVRALRVERHGSYMIVHHFNYTSWPEHGVPESSSTLIQFVKAVRSHRGHDNTTIVVHCSAGVGRTGVFIALDHLIQHVRDHDFVDIYGLVAELRSERMCMVQNLAQYMFLHQSTLDLLSAKGNSQSIWFVNYSALEKMDSLDAMEGDVELEWEETTM